MKKLLGGGGGESRERVREVGAKKNILLPFLRTQNNHSQSMDSFIMTKESGREREREREYQVHNRTVPSAPADNNQGSVGCHVQAKTPNSSLSD